MKRAVQVKQILDIMAAKQKRNVAVCHEEEEKKEETSMQAPSQHLVRPPAFVSLSSKRAFWCRYAALLSREDLMKEMDLVDEVLVDRYDDLKVLGMSSKLKIQSVWEFLHCRGKDSFSEQLQISSAQFDHFSRWIYETMCDKSSQKGIIQQQQEACLKKLTSDDSEMVDKLRQIHLSPWTVRGGDVDSLVASFWALWHACEGNALADFSRTADMRVFETPLNHLCAYKKLLEETKWENMIVIVSAMKSLLQSQLKIIIKQHQQWSFAHWYKRQDQAKWARKDNEKRSWEYLSPMDWANMYSSILLVVNDRFICTRMGKEKIMLENLLQRSNEAIFLVHQHLEEHEYIPPPGLSNDSNTPQRFSSFPRRLFSVKRNGNESTQQTHTSIPFNASDGCPSLERCLEGYISLKNGAFIPTFPMTYSCVVQVEPPLSLEDPSHFGHVGFVYRNVLASIGKRA